MRKHESYTSYYPKSRLSIYLSKGLFWVLLDVVSAFIVAGLVWGLFLLLSILEYSQW